MPVASSTDIAADRGPLDVVVTASAAVELNWRTSGGADVARLWGLGSDATPTEASLPELLVLADRAGVLDCDAPAVVAAAVTAEAGREGAGARLRSEPPVDRRVIVGRLEALAADPTLRGEWSELVTSAASSMAAPWESGAHDAVRRTVRARTSQLPWTDAATAVMEWAGRDYGGLLPELLDDAARTGRPVLVVPAYWSGQGMLFDLDPHLLVGIPARPGPADARARVEPWVPGLKAMADPTRLAILDHLAGRPRSVGELAADFGLAQPTVSRHVRLLRDSGLITVAPSSSPGSPGGGSSASRRYRADGEVIGRLLSAIEASLVSRPTD